MKGYPSWFLRLLVATLAGVLVSGLLLVPTLLLMRADVTLAWRLPAAGRVGVAALHAGTGVLVLMLTGALWSLHMRAGWHKRRRRASGAFSAGALAALAASALALYYLGDEGLAAAAAYVHLGLGIAFTLVFGWHWQAGERLRRPARPATPTPIEPAPPRRFSAD